MLSAPSAGIAAIYAAPGYASAGSDASNYYLITALLNGQSGLIPGNMDTRSGELVAFREYFLGSVEVAQGDIVSLETTLTGALAVRFAPGSFTLRMQVSPRPTGR